MYTPPLNREDRPEIMHALIRERPLGLLISAGGGGLAATPVPFVLHAREGIAHLLECHLAIANPQWREFEHGAEVLVVFQGPQAYITPSWYPSKFEHGKTVPTWNYVVVQVRGTAYTVDDDGWLLRHLNELTDHNEAGVEAHVGEAWKVSDAPDAYVHAQFKGIKGVRIEVRSMEGKWKLSQNRSLADRRGVVQGLDAAAAGGAAGDGAEVAALMNQQLRASDADS